MDRTPYEFERILRSNSYIFHVHTNHTDGHGGVEDYCRVAVKREMAGVVFTEHIRAKPTYDFNCFAAEVADARRRFPGLGIVLGVEAKVLPGGNLDVADDVLERVDVLGIACHGFPYSQEVYARSMRAAISTAAATAPVCVWLHPGEYLQKQPVLDLVLLEDLIELAVANNLWIEYNVKYHTPPNELWSSIPRDKRVVGLNGHSVPEVLTIFNKYGTRMDVIQRRVASIEPTR